MKYCCFICEAIPRFNFIQYGQQALSYDPVQVTINTSLVCKPKPVLVLMSIRMQPDATNNVTN